MAVAFTASAQGQTPIATQGQLNIGTDTNETDSGTVTISNIGTNYADTYSTQGTAPYTFIEQTFSTPETSLIGGLSYADDTFQNGGWFGVTGEDANGNTGNFGPGTLSSTELIAPIVQITLDGTNWTTVADSNNYVMALSSTYTGNGASTEISTFTLDAPVTGIEGIRLIGTDGGYQDNSGTGAGFGFVSLNAGNGFEVLEATPEPSTYALFAAGALTLFALARRRARA